MESKTKVYLLPLYVSNTWTLGRNDALVLNGDPSRTFRGPAVLLDAESPQSSKHEAKLYPPGFK